MRMDAGLDTGPVISQHRIPIAARETAGTLHDKLAAAGGQAIVATLATLAGDGRLDARPQGGENATYAAKITRDETIIDWTASAQTIDRAVRAFNPAPGAGTQFEGALLKIWDAEPAPGRFGTPGVILRADPTGILIACGEGALLVRELQPASGRRMSAAAFLAGHALTTNAWSAWRSAIESPRSRRRSRRDGAGSTRAATAVQRAFVGAALPAALARATRSSGAPDHELALPDCASQPVAASSELADRPLADGRKRRCGWRSISSFILALAHAVRR